MSRHIRAARASASPIARLRFPAFATLSSALLGVPPPAVGLFGFTDAHGPSTIAFWTHRISVLGPHLRCSVSNVGLFFSIRSQCRLIFPSLTTLRDLALLLALVLCYFTYLQICEPETYLPRSGVPDRRHSHARRFNHLSFSWLSPLAVLSHRSAVFGPVFASLLRSPPRQPPASYHTRLDALPTFTLSLLDDAVTSSRSLILPLSERGCGELLALSAGSAFVFSRRPLRVVGRFHALSSLMHINNRTPPLCIFCVLHPAPDMSTSGSYGLSGEL